MRPVITQGYVRVTNKFARIYFLSFYLFCVIVVLNIFVAFILEAFMLEYSFTHGKIETVFNKKIQEKGIGVGMCPIENRANLPLSSEDTSEIIRDQGSNGFTSVEHLALDTGLRFKMPSQQKKNADLLLQEMFADELEEDDIGPKDLEDLDELDESEDIIEARSNRRLTFHTVDAE
ncbi:Ion transport protein [Porites harrisoni]